METECRILSIGGCASLALHDLQCEMDQLKRNVCRNRRAQFAGHQEIRKHHQKRFACDICIEKFTQKKSLHRHMERQHFGGNYPNNEKKCAKCRLTFKVNDNLIQHLQVHKKKNAKKKMKSFICNYCGFRFMRKWNLQRHFIACAKKPQQ